MMRLPGRNGAASAAAWWPAAFLALVPTSGAQTPAYITAKPDAAIRAFGADPARRIFSSAYTAGASAGRAVLAAGLPWARRV